MSSDQSAGDSNAYTLTEIVTDKTYPAFEAFTNDSCFLNFYMVVRKTGMNREERKPGAISNSKLNERSSLCQYNSDYNDCEVGLELDASDYGRQVKYC